ncbi:MAG TPA: HigA family addiction module antitoxin [Alphaproteobacteria bacterium]|nr:HigA family addiction module antitoxin [Alphaproteobacteria bacterium]
MADKTLRHSELPPQHPGALLREIILPSLGLSITDVAARLGVTRQTLHRLMGEKTAVTPEMALRLGKFCGNGPDIWLRMQEAYDLWHAERALRRELARIETVEAA